MADRQSGAALAREIAVPLPLGGINTSARTSEIAELFAAELTNWRSTGHALETRPGHVWGAADNLFGAFQAVPFDLGGVQVLIEVSPTYLRAGSRLWGRADAGRVSMAAISNSAVLVDGVNDPTLFDGAAFSSAEFTTETGVEPTEFVGVTAHQDRLHFWRAGDLDWYYADLGAIMGPLVRFPLSRLGSVSGTIIAMRALTVNAAHGMSDMLAVFTTTGDIVLYEGGDPGDPNDWRFTGRVRVAPPLGPDAFVTIGGDLWMVTASGAVSVAQAVMGGTAALADTVSGPIRDDIVAMAAEGGQWSGVFTPDGRHVIINRALGDAASQFMFDMDGKAWSRADYPARDWHVLGRGAGFTGFDGRRAVLGVEGDPITAVWHTGWFRMLRRGGIAWLRPTIIADGPLTVTVSVLSDHDMTGADIAESQQTVTLLPDNPGERVALNDVIATDAVGSAFQLRIEVTAPWAKIVSLSAGVV
jgi:hypothetical protein